MRLDGGNVSLDMKALRKPVQSSLVWCIGGQRRGCVMRIRIVSFHIILQRSLAVKGRVQWRDTVKNILGRDLVVGQCGRTGKDRMLGVEVWRNIRGVHLFANGFVRHIRHIF